MIWSFIFAGFASAQLPIVLWHGLSQDCCTGETKMITEELKAQFPQTYIKSIRIGSTNRADHLASQFGNINKQVDQICKELKKDKHLSGGFNAIGISQVPMSLGALYSMTLGRIDDARIR
jgi:palmitoyl-protein thioesterase